MKPQEQWEVEFDNQFANAKDTDLHYYNPYLPDIKSFIHSLLKAQEERLVGEIGEILKTPEYNKHQTYDRAVKEIIHLIHSVYNKE